MSPRLPTTRCCVITGVSRGLGRALAESFRDGGHTVIGCCRSSIIAHELSSEFGAPHRFDGVDVSDADAVASWAREVIAQGQVPDLLINNAALINTNHVLWEVPVDEFSHVIDVNVKGIFHVVRAFVPAMLQAERGIIVNLSSGWGRSTSPEVAPYCATKWAVEGLTRSLAQELPSGLAAVALNPGIIDTDMLRSCFGGDAKAYPPPKTWAQRAAPFLLNLTARDNGKSLDLPE